MKQCGDCKAMLPLTQFHFKNRARNRRHAWCKECQKAYSRNHYAKNTAQYSAYHRRNRARYRRRNREQVYTFLALHPCVDCGEGDPRVLEFDHVRGEKMGDVSDMVRCGVRWARVSEEIDKCEVRCANCHRRRTVNQFKWFKENFGA